MSSRSRTKSRTAIGTAGVMVMMAAAIAIAGVKTKVERDEKFNFAKLKTWEWNPSPGVIKVWLTAESKSEPVQRQYEPVIMQAVEEQFAKRGYARAKGSPPDFQVTYYVLVTSGGSGQEVGQFMPTNAQWGIRPWTPQTTSVTYYPKGTLILDAASPALTDLVWRGIAEAKIESDKTDDQRADRVRGIIKDLLSKFPQRK